MKINKKTFLVVFALSSFTALALGACGDSDETGGTDDTPNPVAFTCADAPLAMVEVAAGAFTMGSPVSQAVRLYDEIPHEVTLTRGFCVGKYEVTQAEFKTYMDYDPSHHTACGDTCPAENMLWYEAAAFANAVSEAEGVTPCYSCSGVGEAFTCAEVGSPYECEGYRLPTEAEWEYMARAGSTTSFSNGGNLIQDTEYNVDGNLALDNGELVDDVAWYAGNATTPKAVGGLEANAWGIYDTAGNVWEWCHDVYMDYDGDVTDPNQTGDTSPSYRGGSYYDAAKHSRVENRGGNGYGYTFEDLGFRLVRTLP